MTDYWSGKRVLLTGHTGFKGSWLSLWLLSLGADVYGYALEPDTTPALFEDLGLSSEMNHQIGDVRDLGTLKARVRDVKPDVVFHLAAQPLVLEAFSDPLTTWQTNVIGSVNLMEAIRDLCRPCTVVMIATDKVYENREWYFPYREVDPLGGHDPYSSSKAAMELAIDSWRKSFFEKNSEVRIASARAGNVIGGGDWCANRIIPDLVRALSEARALCVRNPEAIRPWQHVLDPLAGYLRLAESLAASPDRELQSAFNFGPEGSDIRSVRALIDEAMLHWPGEWKDTSDPEQPHEAQTLCLTIEKARNVLNFAPRINFETAVEMTMGWYLARSDAADMREVSLKQIQAYTQR